MVIIKKHIFLIIVLFISVNSTAQNVYLKGKIKFENAQYSQAIIDFDKYIAVETNNKDAYLYRGKAKIALQEYESAISDFSILNAKKNPEIDLLLARAYAGLLDAKQTIVYLKKYLKSKNKLAEEKIFDFPEFGNIADTKEWQDLWTVNWYSKKEYLLANAEEEITAGNFEGAETLLNQYVVKYKANPQAFYLKSQISLSHDNTKDALVYIDKAVDLDPDNENYLLTRAQAEYRLKKYKKSLKTYELLFHKDSLNPDLFYNRSLVFAALKEYNLAKADIEKYVLYYPEKEIGQKRMAKIMEASGDYMSAIKIYGKLIEQHPAKAIYLKERANAYMATHTYKYAIRDYSMALDIYPRDAEIYFQKGNAHYKLHEIQKACSAWKRAEKYGSQETTKLIYKYCR